MWGFFAGDGVGVFVSIWSILFIGYIEISTFWVPGAYNKYVHLVLETLSVPLWLWAWSWLAATAAVDYVIGDFANCIQTDVYGYCTEYGYYSDGPANGTKAAAGLGAIEWALFIGTLISYGIYLHRFRRAEHEARLQGIAGGAVVEEHKLGTVTQQPVYQQQPTGYAPQQPTGYVQQQPTGYVQQQPTGYNQPPVDPRYQGANIA